MTTIKLTGSVTSARTSVLLAQLEPARHRDDVVIDLAEVTDIDSAGVGLLVSFARQVRARGGTCSLRDVPTPIAKTLDLFPFPPSLARQEVSAPGFLETCGAHSEVWCRSGWAYLQLAADVAFFALEGVVRPRRIAWARVAGEMVQMGSRALGVVGLIAALVGGTMALQAAAQLRQFGATVFVVDLLAVSVTRELGPLITAIVVAGRSGSAVAAELGTMVISEEIDALRTMGINPVRMLVVPKVLGIVCVQPVLTVLSSAVAIGAGMLVGATYLDIGAAAFVVRLGQAVLLKDVLTGLFKSVLFAYVIVTIGALLGMQTRGGADAVGRSTTASVVAGIFMVILTDALCSLLFYFGG